MENVTSILNYGTIGLSLLLATLASRQLSKGLSLSKLTRGHIIALTSFYLFCLLLALSGVYLELNSNKTSDSLRLKHLGAAGQSAFSEGGAIANQFAGYWNASYYGIREDSHLDANRLNSDSIFEVDSLLNYFVKYPDEKLIINNEGSVLYVKCKGAFKANNSDFKLWGEGRYSSGQDLTFLYWSPLIDGEDQFVGVNFMHFTKSLRLNGKVQLTGWWIGRSENGEVSHGITKWEKID